MSATSSGRYRYWLVAVVALAGIALSTLTLLHSTDGLLIEHFETGPIPISVYRSEQGPVGPLVVVAHGFAGSRPMMQQIAVTLAQNGYLTATFDFSGHGRNRVPLTGNLQSIDGATQVLVRDIGQVVEALKSRYSPASESLAVLGHSMASDLVVRYAQSDDNVIATVGLAMFSSAVTASSPRNLLVINGEWEPRLNRAAHDVLAQVAGTSNTETGVTYGSFEAGNARRLVLSSNAEHIAVLFSVDSAEAAVSWLNQAFHGSDQLRSTPQVRGPWILVMIVGIVGLWWAIAPLLPVVSTVDEQDRLPANYRAIILLMPMLLTPLMLSPFTISFLPVLVGDYLAVHMAVYGIITAVLTYYLYRRMRSGSIRWAQSGQQPALMPVVTQRRNFTISVFSLLLMSLPLAAAVHWQVASFLPTIERVPLLLSIAVGTVCWSLADEWAMRHCLQWRWSYPVSKLTFLLSLAIAVALDFDGLFFLLLIVPIMVPVLIVFGLLSRWTYQSTGCALVAGLSNALVLAWAIAATFPWVGSGV